MWIKIKRNFSSSFPFKESDTNQRRLEDAIGHVRNETRDGLDTMYRENMELRVSHWISLGRQF